MTSFATVNPLALRGALAAAIAIAITRIISLQRPYWVIMIAVVLVNQTTGQSLRRSVERMTATLAGFTTGWALQWITEPHRELQTGIMLAAVFLAVFFRQSWGRGSFVWMTYFISLYVVFLFAILGEWSPALFVTRIADTFLGAAAALLTTYAVRSPGSRMRLRDEAEALWKSCRTELGEAVEQFGRNAPAKPHTAFLQQLDTLQSHAGEALYETFLNPEARQASSDNLARAEMLCYLALGLFDALACAGNSPLRPRVRHILLQTIEPVTKAELREFMLPPSSARQCPPTPTQPGACGFALEECRIAGVCASDLIWAVPALYYAGALKEAL